MLLSRRLQQQQQGDNRWRIPINVTPLDDDDACLLRLRVIASH
jgi:hypothetical protein